MPLTIPKLTHRERLSADDLVALTAVTSLILTLGEEPIYEVRDNTDADVCLS